MSKKLLTSFCPRQLQRGWFMTAAGFFHGTGVSLFQHAPCDKLNSELYIQALCLASSVETTPQLPTRYTNVPPDAPQTKEQPPVCSYVNMVKNDSVKTLL